MTSLSVVTRPKRVAKSRAIHAIRRYYAPRFVNPWKRLPRHLQTHVKELAAEAFCHDHMQQDVLPQLQRAVVTRCLKQIEAARSQVDELTKEIEEVDSNLGGAVGVINDPVGVLGRVHACFEKYSNVLEGYNYAQETCCDVFREWTEALILKVEQQRWPYSVYGMLTIWFNRFEAARNAFLESNVRLALIVDKVQAAVQ
jgi:phage gp36-like protein